MPLQDHKSYRILLIINSITHFLLGGVTVVCCMFALDSTGTNSFKQHIVLCVVGYILLMSEAILTFSQHNGWSLQMNYQDKKITHLILQLAGSSLAIAGSVIRIDGYPGTHFSTPHGICGWLALILTTMSLVGGVVNFYATKHSRFLKIGHSFTGIATLVIAAICLTIGLNKTSFTTWSSSTSATTLCVFAVVGLIGTLLSACPSLLRRLTN